MIDWKKKFTDNELVRLLARRNSKLANAARRDIAFTLSKDDWLMMGEKLLGKGTCDYTNMPFRMSEVAGYNPCYPSVERIDDKKGYIRGNVCVVMRRANELKDNLVDKKTATTIIDPLDREIVQAMMLYMSKDHMEILKAKYIPQEEEQEMPLKTEVAINKMDSEAHQHVASIMQEETTPVEPVKGPEGEAGVNPEPVKMPDDVAVALAYANYCNSFSGVGMKVSVTYAQFKAKYIRNSCSLTGEKLEKEPKSVLILDLDVGFAKDNFIIVSKKMETAMTTLMIQTGMSLPKVTAMLSKVV